MCYGSCLKAMLYVKKKYFNLKEYQNTYINKTHLLLQKKKLNDFAPS